MQQSNRISEYVIIRASTNSDWDVCDFALIHVTDEWRSSLSKRLKAIEPFKVDDTFYNHTYWECPEGFYQLPDDENAASAIEDILDCQREWNFVELNEDEIRNFLKPANQLDIFELIITGDGYARFVAQGKHTEEQFWTEKFEVSAMIKKH